MLALSARSVESAGAREVAELYNSIKYTISDKSFSIEYMRGIFLKEIFLKMTRIRLLSHSEYPEEDVSLWKYGVDQIVYDKTWSDKCYNEPNPPSHVTSPLPSLQKCYRKFSDYLRDSANQVESCAWSSAKRDCFDVLLVVTLKNDKKPFLLFYDCISSLPLEDLSIKGRLKGLSQARALNRKISLMRRYAENITREALSNGSTTYQVSPLVQALMNGRYSYVYATTSPTPIKGKIGTPNTNIVNIDFTRQYLSFAYPIYEVGRGMINLESNQKTVE